jgi:hypothetical protein
MESSWGTGLEKGELTVPLIHAPRWFRPVRRTTHSTTGEMQEKLRESEAFPTAQSRFELLTLRIRIGADIELPIECLAIDPQYICGLGLVSIDGIEDGADVVVLKLIEADAFVHRFA